MIHVDQLKARTKGTIKPASRYPSDRWCRLFCTPDDEKNLHQFAGRIGLKRLGFDAAARCYWLTPRKRRAAIIAGAAQTKEQPVSANIAELQIMEGYQPPSREDERFGSSPANQP